MTHQVIRKLLCCVLAISYVGAFALDHEIPPPEPGAAVQTPAAPEVDRYQVIVPTLHASQDTSNSGGLRFNFAHRTVGSIRGVLDECVKRGFSPLFWAKHPPEIWIYFPSREYFDLNSQMVAEQVLENFRAVYPDSTPTIRMLIANTPVNVEFLAKELKASVDELARHAPDQAEGLAELKDVIDQTKTEALRLEAEGQKADRVAWYRRKIRGGPHVSAVTSNRIRLYGAFVRAGSLGAIRAYQFMPAFALGPARTAVALSAIAFDAGVEIYTAIFSQVIQTFFLRNPNLRFIQRQAWAPDWIKHPSVDSLVGLLTSGVWNTALFVGVRASIMQSAQAAAMPGMGLHYPTVGSVWDSIRINSGGILANWFWVKGYSLLKDKGWVSGASVNVGLQVLSSTDIGIGVANSSSNPQVRDLRNKLLPLQWGVYVATFLAGTFLPINANRILMVHDRVVEDARAEVQKERLRKNPNAGAGPAPIGVADIPWLNLEQSGLRSLWTIPEDRHEAEMDRAVNLIRERQEAAGLDVDVAAAKSGRFTRWWPFRKGKAAAVAPAEACGSDLETPTAEQIENADDTGVDKPD